jgi:hypothetical protein
MSDEQLPPRKLQLALPVSPERTQHFYSTGSGVEGLRWTVLLSFTKIQLLPEGPTEETACLVEVPWPLAKVFHEALGREIEAYEKIEGKINVPNSAKNKIAKEEGT